MRCNPQMRPQQDLPCAPVSPPNLSGLHRSAVSMSAPLRYSNRVGAVSGNYELSAKLHLSNASVKSDRRLWQILFQSPMAADAISMSCDGN